MTAAYESGQNDDRYPKIVLHVWHGMSLSIVWRLLRENRFSCSWQRVHRAVIIVMASILNSVLNRLAAPIFDRRTAAVELDQAPIFIIGHWRTGTTLLHELLIRDPRLTCPNTYRCMAPRHFLLSEQLLPHLVGFLLPKHRPMDNMAMSWERPQEDEFAMSNQGVPTPYWFYLYPDRPCPYDRYLDLHDLSESERETWKRQLVAFLKRLAYRDPRRLVLKSPPHTARIRTLLEIFPDARFIHLSRDPQVMIPSTLRTWRRLGEVMGLRVRVRDDLADYVLATFRRMYDAFERDRALLAPDRLVELRYEDLIGDMKTSVRAIYDRFAMDGFEDVLPGIEAYAHETSGYRPNSFNPDRALRARIAEVCFGYADRYGYTAESVV